MYRGFAILLLGTIITLPAIVEGQGRGGRPGFVGRTAPGAPAGRAPASGRPAFVVHARPAFPAGRPPAVIGRNRNFALVRPHPRVIITQPFGFYSPFSWPAPIYGTSIYTPSINTTPAYVAPEPQPPSQSEVDLAYQVGRLTQEVEQLRAEQALRQSRQTPSETQPPVERPAIPTVLIFRDGHRVEIQNYMIVGQTLWVVDEQNSTKIPLSDLDLDATRKENRERGIRFLPSR